MNKGTCLDCNNETELVKKSVYDYKPKICRDCRRKRSLTTSTRLNKLVIRGKIDPLYLDRARASQDSINRRFG